MRFVPCPGTTGAWLCPAANPEPMVRRNYFGCEKRSGTVPTGRDGASERSFDDDFFAGFGGAVDTVEDVHRFESGHNHGHTKLARKPLVVGIADNGADMSRRKEPLHTIVGCIQHRLDCRRHKHVGHEHGVVGQPQPPRIQA